jgi:hypothetical protein
VTCETCHRTLSSTVGVATPEAEKADAEAPAVEATPEPVKAAAPAKPKPSPKAATAKPKAPATRRTTKSK